MSGTHAGGVKTAKTNKQKHGKDFYKKIGSMGGRAEHTKPRGFAANPELAKMAGSIGGLKSSRLGVKNGEGKNQRSKTKAQDKEEPKKRHFFVFRRSDNAK